MDKKETREVVKIEFYPGTKQKVIRWTDKERGKLPQVMVFSRIIEWFAAQPDLIQRSILGLMGDHAIDVSRLVVEELARRPSSVEASADEFERAARVVVHTAEADHEEQEETLSQNQKVSD